MTATAIKAGTMIDATGAQPVKNVVLIVENGRIQEIRRGDKPEVPSGAKLVDLSGFVVTPGLMDIHLHMAAPSASDYPNTDSAHIVRTDADMLIDTTKNARVMLEAGFTTVRDLDWLSAAGRNFCSELASLRDAIALGKVPGPRMIVGAFTHTTASHFDRNLPRNFHRDPMYVADGPWEIRKLTRLNFRNGADHIKTCISGGTGTFDCRDHIMDRNIHIDELKALVDEAHAYRRLAAAHAHTPNAVRMALEAGIDIIEHCVMTDDDAVQRLAESKKYCVPTLAFREESVIQKRRERGTPEFVIQQMLEKRDISNETFKRYFKAGVKIAMGTDTHVDPPFGENAREIEIYASLGMTNMQALQTATRNAADALQMLDQLGTLEKGKLCDLIAINGNPLDDIGIFRKPGAIQVVMKEGEIAIDRRLKN